MRLTDAQVHIWGADTPERPWPRAGMEGRTATAQREPPLGVAELLDEMNRAGVAAALLVPPSWEGERNDLALAAAAAHPDRFAVMGRLAPDDPESPARLKSWRAQPGMLGLRFIFGPGIPWLLNGAADWLWPQAEKLGLPIMIAPGGALPHVARIAERHPGLKLVVDHMAARAHHKDADAFQDLPELLALARHDNVAVKATAIPCYSSAPYPFRNLHGHLRQAFDAFGPRRMFWGTDLSRLPCSYTDAIRLFTQELDWLKGDDLAWVMGRGVRAWLGWG